jgi:DNA (cytosine-5)-methyltransferase 1
MRVVWSLFSGAMGLDLGLEIAGMAACLAVEIDADCCETIRYNRRGLRVLQRDLSSLTGADLRASAQQSDDVYMMVGGPPCQSFSSGGKRAALSDPRGNLIYEYLRLIGEVRPQYFVFENVANLVTAALCHRKIEDRPGKHWNLNAYSQRKVVAEDDSVALSADEMSGSAIRQILRDLSALGYGVRFGIVDAADFGAPQHRLRFLLIGARNSAAPPLPVATHGSEGSGLAPFRTVRDAIYDLRTFPGDHSEYTASVARYFDLVKEGCNWRSLPAHLQREAMGGSYEAGGGKTGFYRRLAWDTPSPTITGRANRKGSAMCHPEFTRPLSVSECARIQGFPDDWHFVGSMAQRYMQIGNAVPVALGVAIGRCLLEPAAKDGIGVTADFEKMLCSARQRLQYAARNKKSIRGPGQQELVFAEAG